MTPRKEKRNMQIIKLRDKKSWTLEAIGKEFNITKQTTHEIYHREKKRQELLKKLSPLKV